MSSSNGTRAARPRAAVADKPAPVALNLDTLAREGGDVEPFVAVFAGRRVTFTDPHDLDWQEAAAAMDDPRMMFRLALSEDDAHHLLSNRMTIRQVNTLVETYLRHYGWDTEALGKLAASRT
jgi:hypothetical protein